MKYRKDEENRRRSLKVSCESEKNKPSCLELAELQYIDQLVSVSEIRALFQLTCNSTEIVGCRDYLVFEKEKGNKDEVKRIGEIIRKFELKHQQQRRGICGLDLIYSHRKLDWLTEKSPLRGPASVEECMMELQAKEEHLKPGQMAK